MSDIRILIVEDEKIVARDIQRSVEKMGYAVCALASSGEEAIQKALETLPDLVLMDIVLKTELDGISAGEQLTRLLNIPIIYLTACDDEMILTQSRKTSCYGYIIKPFDEQELHRTIELALYKKQMDSRLGIMEKRLSTIIHDIGKAVITTDRKGCVIYMNEIAENLTGWKNEEALGKSLKDVLIVKDISLSDLEKEWLGEVIAKGLQRSSKDNVKDMINMRSKNVSEGKSDLEFTACW